tara:strand:- start:1970 stop:2830 length:861 start_codon:yes stop_codon:yes gene_type:complete
MSEEKKDKPNLENQFKQAFNYLGPQLITQIFSGTDAANRTQGILDKMRSDAVTEEQRIQQRKLQEAQEGRAIEKDSREERSLKVRERGSELREQELDVSGEREANRREEMTQKRYEDAVSKFTKRKDVQRYQEFSGTIDSIKDMVESGKKIPGASLALVARGLSREVGVLTNQDIERAQVNPDILSKIKRNYYRYFKGEISPEDAKEMLKIANAIKGKQEGRFKKIAEKEANMRSSKMSDADKQRMRKDFLGQVYIYEDEVKEGELSPEEMKELKELEALEKQGKL